ncbi:MAG: hypothetical protein MJE63_21045 [Proteobacteria bacterium]|nr:hypothetical protein [Pseudomonadota bacterium]
MSKILIALLIGFIIYKVGKNAAYLALENILGNKALKEPEDLVKCTFCERLISEELVIKHRDHDFCSQDCIDASINKPS